MAEDEAYVPTDSPVITCETYNAWPRPLDASEEPPPPVTEPE